MAVYVDEIAEHAEINIKPAARRYGQRWSHLTADSDEELHAFAARLGLKRGWFQTAPRQAFRHYDVVPSKRALAVKFGAIEVRAREHFKTRLDAELAAAT